MWGGWGGGMGRGRRRMRPSNPRPRTPWPTLFPPPQVMCGDYGFRSGASRMYQGEDGEVPGSGVSLVRRDGEDEGRWSPA